jgi:hypothetical protein
MVGAVANTDAAQARAPPLTLLPPAIRTLARLLR